MASNEIEVLEPTATVEKLTEIKSGRALDRRRFMTAVGVAGAASGAILMSARRSAPRPGVVLAAGPAETDLLNYILNIVYLEATFYSYVTQGADLPGAVTAGSGAITGNPAKLVFTGANASQITDLFNELYYDELSHVKDLLAILGPAAVARPAINLAAYATIAANNAIGIARLIEDVGVTAYAGVMGMFSTSTNLTYAAQILGVESMHAGALRLVTLQNPTIAPYFPTGGSGVTFTASTTAGSPTLSNVYFLSTTVTTVIAVGNIVTGPGIPGAGLKVTAITATKNTAITGTIASGSATITAVSSVAGLVAGQLITGTGIPAGATITVVGTTTLTISANATASTTALAITVGVATITLSGNATTSVTSLTFNTGNTDSTDVAPFDPGTATLSAAGPTASGGFFATAGAASATTLNPAGMAFARTTSQALAILYGAAGVDAVAGNFKGGFYVNGMTGAINTI